VHAKGRGKKRAESQAYRKTKLNRTKPAGIALHSTQVSCFKTIFFMLLVGLVTPILLREMVQFYFESESSRIFTWIKALAREGLVLGFSAASPAGFARQVLYKSLELSICAFTIYAMSLKQIGMGQGTICTEKLF